MKPYFYINGLRIIEKLYNKDKIDFRNIRTKNYFRDRLEAEAELRDLEEKLMQTKCVFCKKEAEKFAE